MDRLCHVHLNVGDFVCGQSCQYGQEHRLDYIRGDDGSQGFNAEQRGEPVEVVGFDMETEELGKNVLGSPWDAEDLGQRIDVGDSSFTDREDRI